MDDVIDLRERLAAEGKREEDLDEIVGVRFTVAAGTDRQAYLLDSGWDGRVFIMPCRERYSFSTETVPTDDLPCECGNKKHVVVQWVEVR